VAWNANWLIQHIKEVEVFLNTQKIDILLVSETHFKEQNYINTPNYITYATNHPDCKAHAGSAIIIRKDIKHHELAKYETDHIQATKSGMEI
jgi:exonuclease III